jgi:hypothetical protein
LRSLADKIEDKAAELGAGVNENIHLLREDRQQDESIKQRSKKDEE